MRDPVSQQDPGLWKTLLIQVFHSQFRPIAFPRCLKQFVHELRVVSSILRFEGLTQSKERTRVTWIALQVFTEDFLRLCRISADQEYATQSFTHGEKPI